MTITVDHVLRGDIVRFAAYALRVEDEPKRVGNFVYLRGRVSVGACPILTKKLFFNLPVTVDARGL